MKRWLRLAFDPYFETPDHKGSGSEISLVFLKGSSLQTKNDKFLQGRSSLKTDDKLLQQKNKYKKALDKLESLLPKVSDICQEAVKLQRTEKDTGAVINPDTEERITLESFIDKLDSLLTRHLPQIEGDRVIQIGTTYKRYGETDCFLKHIITLDTCAPIDNQDLIADEHKSIVLPDKVILQEIRNWAKEAIEEKVSKPEILESLIRKASNKRLKTLKSRLGRAAFYATLSIFLTNIVSLLAIEIPATKILTGHFNFLAIGVDILGPTFLMFLLVVTIKLPKKENLEKVVMEAMKIIYKT